MQDEYQEQDRGSLFQAEMMGPYFCKPRNVILTNQIRI